MNKVLIVVQRLGLGMPDLPVLVLPGRRTGKLRRTPVSVLTLDGHRYLLAGFPGSDWPANARAAGSGTLRVGRREEHVRLVELNAEDARPVLRAWPGAYAQGADMMRDAGVVTDVTPEAFEQVAGVCPVFRIEGIG